MKRFSVSFGGKVINKSTHYKVTNLEKSPAVEFHLTGLLFKPKLRFPPAPQLTLRLHRPPMTYSPHRRLSTAFRDRLVHLFSDLGKNQALLHYLSLGFFLSSFVLGLPSQLIPLINSSERNKEKILCPFIIGH